MNAAQTQSDFETWMRTGKHPDITELALEKLPDGSYKSQLTFAAWQAWQGAVQEFDWRGIETAPLDGRWITGLGNDGSIYRISWGRNYNNQMAWCTSFASFTPGYITHWTWLPELPERN